MLQAEYILSVLGQLLCVGVSLWVLIKINRLAGTLMFTGFLLALIQMLVMTLIPDLIEFDFSSEELTFFGTGVISPVWYKVLVVCRTIALFGIPIGIYLALKNRNEGKT